jgi:hypothetical protein
MCFDFDLVELRLIKCDTIGDYHDSLCCCVYFALLWFFEQRSSKQLMQNLARMLKSVMNRFVRVQSSTF